MRHVVDRVLSDVPRKLMFYSLRRTYPSTGVLSVVRTQRRKNLGMSCAALLLSRHPMAMGSTYGHGRFGWGLKIFDKAWQQITQFDEHEDEADILKKTLSLLKNTHCTEQIADGSV